MNAVDAIAHGDDGIEAVVHDLARNLPRSLGSNNPEIPDCCLLRELAAGVDVAQVLVHGAHVHAEELGHLRRHLRRPRAKER